MIVETQMDLYVLSDALGAVSDATLTIERVHAGEEVPLRTVFWAYSDTLDRFEEALGADPTVADYRRLSAFDGARLYRTRHPPDLSVVTAYDTAIATDTMLIDAVADRDGWQLRLWMPDRSSLTSFRDVCTAAGIDLAITSMYHDQPQPVGDLYGLTESQREVLLLAAEKGYFTIPRENSLADLADELDLSSQAVSERLRRGMRTLVDTVLVDHYPIESIAKLDEK